MQPVHDKGLLEQLVSLYHDGDFEPMFEMLTQDFSGPQKLQLKIELRQLMMPINKEIDLRGRVKGECRPYHLNERQHWLDDVALNIYHQRIQHYGGVLCYGLYQEIIHSRNSFRVLHKQQTETKPPQEPTQPLDPFAVNMIRFGHYLSREEHRVQISTQVTLVTDKQQTIHGNSYDLSFSGAKIKVPAAFHYQLGEVIALTFPILAEKLNDDRLNQSMYYRVLAIDDIAENQSSKWLRLATTQDNLALKEAILKIKQVAAHSRDDHQDKFIRARTKGYEHCYLKHSTGLPLFFSQQQLSYALLTEHNRHLWHYWHDERNLPNINHLLNPQRMAMLTKHGLSHSRTLIYSFCHQHEGKSYFYSACLPEMSLEQRRLFWHLGAARDSWRVWQLTLSPLQGEDLAQLNELAPDQTQEYQNFTHIALLQDLTDTHAQQDYRLTLKPNASAKILQPFRHQRDPICQASAILFDPRPQRSEERFTYQTELTISHETGSFSGCTVDFSTKGLNIQLASPLVAKRDDEIAISFPQLQQKNKQLPLADLRYRIVRINAEGTNLQAQLLAISSNIKGESCLKNIVKHNAKHLAVCEEDRPQHVLLQAMHQLLLTRLDSVPYFVEKLEHKLTVTSIGCNIPLPSLAKLFQQFSHTQQPNGFSLAPIFKGRVQTMLAKTLRPVTVTKPYSHELYLHLVHQQGKTQCVASWLLQEFESTQARITFIEHARSNGEIKVLRITAAPIFDSMTLLTQQKLSELARLTLHRARGLENEFSALVGCGEIFDITDEVLVRLAIS
ncbi:PilZ domain-containing protein [Photobacterium damselae]|uniref:PilZ domain-containing protein n=1 Tax=Photobacterium damselae TaxID=38293 RepID=UPI000D663888|nr:PilZ domain-containing protein [Photobacterium damselae]AWK82673.1 pilus assembly protein PilZ [Photobacterium damselae]NVH46598.1 PilZ domain-containing protein [Photobacterium damselae subsp. damselae]